MTRSQAKIFGIGASKTGTSTLGACFELLGYTHIGWNEDLEEKYLGRNFDYLFDVAEKYQSFEDTPWNSDNFFKELDRRFPGSKFILTVRDTRDWFRSYSTYFRGMIPDVADKERKLIADYERRNREVIEYFAQRPGDLLVINICAGEGWQAICPFLGVLPTGAPFPHRNKNPHY